MAEKTDKRPNDEEFLALVNTEAKTLYKRLMNVVLDYEKEQWNANANIEVSIAAIEHATKMLRTVVGFAAERTFEVRPEKDRPLDGYI